MSRTMIYKELGFSKDKWFEPSMLLSCLVAFNIDQIFRRPAGCVIVIVSGRLTLVCYRHLRVFPILLTSRLFQMLIFSCLFQDGLHTLAWYGAIACRWCTAAYSIPSIQYPRRQSYCYRLDRMRSWSFSYLADLLRYLRPTVQLLLS